MDICWLGGPEGSPVELWGLGFGDYAWPMERIDPGRHTDERTTLREFLDYQRAVMLHKCAGLTAEQVKRCIAASTISVGGMLKHLALVENHWFAVTFAGQPEAEPWASVDWDNDPDWEWRTGNGEPLDELLLRYKAAIELSNSILDDADSLDQRAAMPDRHGENASLRWILVHMIEETARHLGHLDLLREAIDGQTGD